MKTIRTEKIPIMLWLDEIEESTMNQARNLANLPFAFRHIAIMPDAHVGYGMPIGGVLATKDFIIPNAVGVDIGCGMCAQKSLVKEINREDLKRIMGEIRKRIPVGITHHKTKQDMMLMPGIKEDNISTTMPVVNREFENAQTQVGTLGSGNHFIEIQRSDDGFIWIMIHSGSRNIGKQVADYYNKLAKKLNGSWKEIVPPKADLAYLPIGSYEGESYIREMNYCVEFAFANRKLMMERIKECFNEVLNRGEDIFPFEMINIAHNYAKEEMHYGEKVYVHRKGATEATKDTIGIIPGSQGTKSFIVKGKGNKESFNSCSHGAGRLMGREQAIRELNLAEEIRKLDDLGILHAIRGKRDLDEASSAYKDINQVMKKQEDLVEVLVELSPLGVIKG